jgi:hypothetical protein
MCADCGLPVLEMSGLSTKAARAEPDKSCIRQMPSGVVPACGPTSSDSWFAVALAGRRLLTIRTNPSFLLCSRVPHSLRLDASIQQPRSTDMPADHRTAPAKKRRPYDDPAVDLALRVYLAVLLMPVAQLIWKAFG